MAFLHPDAGRAAAPADPVIATRGADTIRLHEARDIVATLDAQSRAKLTQDPDALTSMLRDLLLRRAVVSEAAARHWADRPEVAALLARVHDQVLAEAYLSAQTAPAPDYPSEADLHSAYDQNRQRLLLPRQYHLMQAYIPAQAGPADAARRRLAALKPAGAQGLQGAAKKAGIAFGDLGWVAENALMPDVRTTVAGVPEGQIADPVCTASGCSLILLVATKPAGPASFTEARATLVQGLRQQRQQANARAYENGLLAKAPVRVNELQFPAVLSP